MLAAGKDTDSTSKIKSNMTTNNCPLAPLYTLRKDHKATKDPIAGPPVRPVCGAVQSFNQHLSHLMSLILTKVWKDKTSVCMSTEEMLAEIRRVNELKLKDNVIVGSADVKSLYPSLDIEFTVEKACELLEESEVRIEGIDVDEIGLYQALNHQQSYLRAKGLLKYCRARRTKRGRCPLITGCGMEERKGKRFAAWRKAKRTADRNTRHRLLVEAMKVALLFIMNNHVYSFNKEVKKQQKGGAIGLELTGVLAQLFIVW